MPWAVLGATPRLDQGTSTLGLSGTSRRICRVTSTYSSLTLDRLREHREAIRDVLARYGAEQSAAVRVDRARYCGAG